MSEITHDITVTLSIKLRQCPNLSPTYLNLLVWSCSLFCCSLCENMSMPSLHAMSIEAVCMTNAYSICTYIIVEKCFTTIHSDIWHIIRCVGQILAASVAGRRSRSQEKVAGAGCRSRLQEQVAGTGNHCRWRNCHTKLRHRARMAWYRSSTHLAINLGHGGWTSTRPFWHGAAASSGSCATGSGWFGSDSATKCGVSWFGEGASCKAGSWAKMAAVSSLANFIEIH